MLKELLGDVTCTTTFLGEIPERKDQLSWKVTLSNDKGEVSITYSAGFAQFAPCLATKPKTLYEQSIRDNLKTLMRRGTSVKNAQSYSSVLTGQVVLLLNKCPLPDPSLDKVIECLIADAAVRHYASFAEWAVDWFGASEDSIKAKQVYDECVPVAFQLITMFGSETVNKLEEYFYNI